MARKLIDQDEVARILGVTPEQVGSLRDRKKLFPYRDGDQWKYKQEDIDRLKEEMDEEKSTQHDDEPAWASQGDAEEVELELNDDLDSILLSEIELGKSSTEGASTIIGKLGGADMDLPMAGDTKPPKPPAAGDSSIPLAGGPGASAPKGDSTIMLGNDPPAVGGSSGFSLAGDSEIKLADDHAAPGGSGFALPGDTGLGIDLDDGKGDSGITLAGDSNLTLGSDVKLGAGSSKAGMKPGSSDKLFGSDALKLSDDELSLMDVSPADTAKPAKKGSGSSIRLGDEDLEVVLGGSDVTQSPTDSGIQLISASDSGLSLDQPLDLGSSARRLLDVEDAAPTAKKKGKADSDAEVEIQGDDDFLLSAMDDTGMEESSDSGSQVIALDTDDELSSGMFAPVAGAGDLLEEEPVSAAPMSGAPLLTSAPALTGAPTMMAYSEPVEAPFSGANVAILAVCAVFLLFCGMISFDLMRNMWSWDGPYSVNSSIMESVGKTVGWMDK
ncbi:MAG TPA: helix-turn-helix domain-containing protein [Pirellulales bacterium]|jgi:hypothetical protein